MSNLTKQKECLIEQIIQEQKHLDSRNIDYPKFITYTEDNLRDMTLKSLEDLYLDLITAGEEDAEAYYADIMQYEEEEEEERK